jgi:hypothetical protein
MGTINNLASYLQSELSAILPSSGASTTGISTTGNASASTSTSAAAASQTDNQQLSPFAQMISELQQLQQTNPTQYAEVTGKIATNLQSAAQTAQADGNSTAANQLNQLAADFTSASQSGQLPDIQDLAQAQATGGHHHHHHHSESSSTDPSSTSSTDATSTDAWSSSSQSQGQLLSSYQASGSQSGSLDPSAIILNTLSSAGITSSNS